MKWKAKAVSILKRKRAISNALMMRLRRQASSTPVLRETRVRKKVVRFETRENVRQK
jgi:hypothetical protein